MDEASNLHEQVFARRQFARGDKIAQRQICTKGQFCTSDKFARLSNLRGLGLGLTIRVKKIKLGLALGLKIRVKKMG